MQSIKQLMKDLGWEGEKSESVARAFIKNLVNAADETKRPIALKPKPWAPQKPIKMEKQLSFDLDAVGSVTNNIKKSS